MIRNIQNTSYERFSSAISVLIVSDDTVSQKTLARQLAGLGCSSVVASDGKRAVELIEDEEYFDVILIDCDSKDLTDLEEIQTIERCRGGELTPTVALSMSFDNNDAEKCYRYGVKNILSKPVDLDDLVSVLGKWCQTESMRLMDEAAPIDTLRQQDLSQWLEREFDGFKQSLVSDNLPWIFYHINRLKQVARQFNLSGLTLLSEQSERHLHASYNVEQLSAIMGSIPSGIKFLK